MKINDGNSELRQGVGVGREDETIELNGRSIKDGSISQKKSERADRRGDYG